MDTEGQFAPTDAAAAQERYESLGPVAQTVVREVAKAMDLSPEAYEERVTSEVVETAREVLFASQLAVHVGTREEFEDWLDEREREGSRGDGSDGDDSGDGDSGSGDSDGEADSGDIEVVEFGSEHVDNVVWHEARIADTVLAATYQDERGAAVETLRRQALGRVYRDVV